MTTRLAAPQRRRQVLDAARGCFARDGYRGTTTARLAAAAGVAPPILYRHFSGKRDLFIAVIDDAAERLLATWRARAARAPRRLGGLVEAAAALGASMDGRILARALNERHSDSALVPALRRAVQRLHGYLAAELVRATLLSGADVDAAAQVLLRAALGSGLVDGVGARRADPAALGRLLEIGLGHD